MVCNHGVGSSILPRSTNEFKGLCPKNVLFTKSTNSYHIPSYNKAWTTFDDASAGIAAGGGTSCARHSSPALGFNGIPPARYSSPRDTLLQLP